jgi:predicted nucleic acid-binding protein
MEARAWAKAHSSQLFLSAIRDGMIAATALEHGFGLVTRNVTDFTGAGVALVNPWQV